MNRESCDQWCERGILGLMLGILGLGPLAFGGVHAWAFLAIQGALVVILLLWLVRLWAHPQPRLLWPLPAWAVLGFTAYVVARYWYADIEYAARLEMIQVVVYAGIFLVTVVHLHRREFMHVLVYAMIALGTGISIYALYQFTTHSGRVWNTPQYPAYAGRASGTYVCPNHLAGFLELLLPVALSLLLAGKIGHATRLLLGYACLAMAGGIAVTVSRAGWLAAAVSLAMLLTVLLWHRRQWLPVLLVILLLVGGGAYFYSTSRAARARIEAMNDADHDLGLRTYYWAAALDIWRENPWVGGGGGYYDYGYRLHRAPRDRTQGRPIWAHNDYLNTLADYGTLGAALVLAALGLTAFSAARAWKYVRKEGTELDRRGGTRAPLVLGLGAGLAGIAVHSLFDFNLHIPANAILTVVWLALLSSFVRFTGNHRWVSLNAYGKTLLSLGLLAAIAFLGLQGWRRGRQEGPLRAAAGTQSISLRLNALKRAYAWEPMNANSTQEIGWLYWLQCKAGNEGYRDLAREGLAWYQRGMELNQHDPYAPMGYGLCLDQLGRHREAREYFQHALNLDPNSYYMLCQMGWHYLQEDNYPLARRYLTQSIGLNWLNNPDAYTFLKIVARSEELDKTMPRTPQ